MVCYIRQALALLVLMAAGSSVSAECPWTDKNQFLEFKVGLLLWKRDVSFSKDFQAFLNKDSTLKKCVRIFFMSYDIWHDFRMPVNGWTKIKDGMIGHSTTHTVDTDLVIGPYYMNLAMMLEQMGIPYLVTDNKGYEWTDLNRVDDPVQWTNMVELIPQVREQNRAVVDLFLKKNWDSVVMIMSDNNMANQECQDLATQMINSGVSLIPFSVTTNSRDTRDSLQSVLRIAELQGETRIIICSPKDKHDRLIRDVLLEAKRFDLIGKDESIFMVTEPTSTIHALAGNNFFKLGLYNARCMILAFRFVPPHREGRGKFDIHQAAANDSGRVVQEALKMFFVDNKDKSKLRLSSRELISYMKKVEIQGDTGWIQFNNTGQRVNYTLDLYNHGGANVFSKVAHWKPTNVSSRSDRQPGEIELGTDTDISREDSKIGIFPDIVKVVTVVEKPFVIKRDNDFVGFTIDILNRLAKMLHFQYEIYVSPGNRYGVKDNDQDRWDGMIGEILNGNATLAMGAISITSQREQVVDFSLGVISTGIDILIPKPNETFTIFQFFKPFSPNLWLAIVGSFLLVSLVYFALDYAYDIRQFTMKETFWFSVGTLMRRDTDFSPRHSSQRILSAGFTFFVLITVSTYTANMAAFLTTTNIEETIESLEDLANTKNVHVYTVADSATMNFLKRGTKPVYNRLWQKIKSHSGLLANASEAIKIVQDGKGVFVFDYLINQYAEMQECKTRSVASPIMLQEHGIGMPAGAPFKSKIDIALLKMIEDGTIRNLRKRWWYDKRRCDPLGKSEKSPTKIQFELKHMAGVFIVGLFGLACSAAFFLFKKFYLLAKPIEVPKE